MTFRTFSSAGTLPLFEPIALPNVRRLFAYIALSTEDDEAIEQQKWEQSFAANTAFLDVLITEADDAISNGSTLPMPFDA